MTPAERTEFTALRDRVEVLEMALGLTYEAPVGWGLTATESRLLGLLIKIKVATRDRLMTALYAHTDNPPDDGILQVYISRIRRKTGVEILAQRGIGYMLSRADLAKLAA